MTHSYHDIIDDLRRCVLTPALEKRAAAALNELLAMHQQDQAEIVRLRRMIEAREAAE